MARLAGLEPATPGLEGRCSIQMSYRRTLVCYRRERRRMARPKGLEPAARYEEIAFVP
jgi:hypothetical protein